MHSLSKISRSSLLLALLLVGCSEEKKTNTLYQVDVTKSYPHKEFFVEDIFDVEYIPLKTKEGYITEGSICAIGSKYIVVMDKPGGNEILMFDIRTGDPAFRMNHHGPGPEEYSSSYATIVLDEENEELFVDCDYSRKIQVYSFSGDYKRTINYPEGIEVEAIRSFDKDHLFIYDRSFFRKNGVDRGDRAFHKLLSKKDGSVVEDIYLPFEKYNSVVFEEDGRYFPTDVTNIHAHPDGWLLSESSSDTIYQFHQESMRLHPFLVKTPTVDPTYFLQLKILTDKYIFFNGVKKECDFQKPSFFPVKRYVLDRTSNEMNEIEIYHSDFVEKKPAWVQINRNNQEVAMHLALDGFELVDAYESGNLKGKLKEVAATLKEESNPVIMLMKYKK